MSRQWWRTLGRWRLGQSSEARQKRSRREATRAASIRLESLEPRLVMSAESAAFSTQLLKDTDPTLLTDPSSDPDSFAVLNQRAFFAATNSANGRELWVTDGTSEGTRLFKDLRLGEVGSDPQKLVTIGNAIYFTADDGEHGRELWKSDGTEAGTVLVTDLLPGSGGTPITEITSVNQTLYLSTATSLLRSDGTAAGTTLLKSGMVAVKNLTAFQGNLYFATSEGLMRSDGTPAGTTLVASMKTVAELTATSNKLLFRGARSNNDLELFRSDGTDAGTQRVKDINPNAPSNPTSLRAVNDRLYFLARDGQTGTELWTSDGTASGTQLVSDLTAGNASSNIKLLGDLNGELCLWESNKGVVFTNGTAAGTRVLTGINPLNPQGFRKYEYARGAVRVGNSFVFALNDFLAVTDGTNAGTRTTVALPGSFPTDSTNPFVALGQQVLFSQDTDASGRELWTSNVVEAKLLRDINSDGTRGVSRGNQEVADSVDTPVEANGRLFFISPDATWRRQVWQTNGTSGDTSLVVNLTGEAGDLAAAAGRAFFTEARRDAATNTTTYAVWATDGIKVTLLRSSSESMSITTFNGAVYISSPSGIWRSNGTVSGTQLVLSGTGLGETFAAGSNLFFTEQTSSGERLMRLDGNTAIPLTVPNGSLLAVTSEAPRFTAVGNRLLYRDQEDGVWSSDGTVAGTIPLGVKARRIESFGTHALLRDHAVTSTSPNVPRYAITYLTDGTVAGTRPLSAATSAVPAGTAGILIRRNANEIVRAYPSFGTYSPVLTLPSGEEIVSTFRASDGRLYFATINDAADLGQLWVSDGTEAGTVALRMFRQPVSLAVSDLFIHTLPEFYRHRDAAFGPFGEINGRVVVPVLNAAYGYEPWVISTKAPVTMMLPSTGAADFRLARDGADVVLKQGATVLQRVALTSLDQLTLVGTSRGETLTIDYSAGNPLPLEVLFQAGGTTDSDRLVLQGGSASDVRYSQSGADAGSLTLDRSTITFSSVAAVENQLAAARQLLTFTSGRDNLTLQDDGAANNGRSKLVRGAMSLTFAHPSSLLALQLGGGNDSLRVNSVDAAATGFLQVDGGDGHDSIVGGRLPLYALPGAGNDSLTGGSANDTLMGGAGNDSLIGGDGNDLLDGGEGNDLLNGGNGDDSLLGQAGNDGLAGGAGNDQLNGHGGRNTLLGGSGNDNLLASSGDDIALGGDGDDTINAGGGQDTVSGGGNGSVVTLADVIHDVGRDLQNAFTFTALWTA